MGVDQTSKFCPLCQKPTLWSRPGTNHILHLLLTVFTVGFWLPVWILASIRIGGWRCQSCGFKGSLASRFVAPVVCVVLFLALVSFVASGHVGTPHEVVQSQPQALRSSTVVPMEKPQPSADTKHVAIQKQAEADVKRKLDAELERKQLRLAGDHKSTF